MGTGENSQNLHHHHHNINDNNNTSTTIIPVSDSYMHAESFYSPRETNSPVRYDAPDGPEYRPAEISSGKAFVAVEKYSFSHRPDHRNQLLPPPQPDTAFAFASSSADAPSPSKSPVKVREDATAALTRIESGGEMQEAMAVTSILSRSQLEENLRRTALGIRVSEMVLCLISFSIMAADKTQGWSGDSFDRYKEYRYCLSVTVIAFLYSVFQAYDLAYHLITGKHLIHHHLHYHLNFCMDQVLAYLLMSASSAAASRVDDWQSNWGKDEFTKMASASIGMSFMAFFAFALSSVISGYDLCTRDLADI